MYDLTESCQEAQKFMRHAKRGHLTTEDINQALRLKNVQVRQLHGNTYEVTLCLMAHSLHFKHATAPLLSYFDHGNAFSS